MSGSAPTGLVVWWDEPADGPTNMAADELLAAEADARGTPLLRIYGWSQTTVSLGAFQRFDEASGIAAIRGVPVVRRPSGGGAIVHGSDLTYAAAVPKGHPWGAAPQAFYDALHSAMALALAVRGIDARPYGAAGGPAAPGGEAAFLCFDRRSAGDLVVDGGGPSAAAGCKIMGSAQRRLAGVVLQHGSLLLRANPDVREAARHRGVADVSGAPSSWDRDDLARGWIEQIAASLGVAVQEEPTSWIRGRADPIAAAAERFRDDRWTRRR